MKRCQWDKISEWPSSVLDWVCAVCLYVGRGRHWWFVVGDGRSSGEHQAR